MSKPFFWIFALLLCGLSSTKAQPLPTRAPVRGVVVDESNQPLSGVALSLRRQSEAGSFGFWGGDAQSDARGQFVFPDAEEGNYALTTEFQGFDVHSRNVQNWTTASESLRVQLRRLVRVRVRVLGTNGAPLSNSPVWISLRGDNTRAESNTQQFVLTAFLNSSRPRRTDAAGWVSLGEVAPGDYALWARTETEFALASPQTLSSTNAEKLEITLQRGGTLRARVQDSSNRALGGATLVSLTPDSPESRAMWNGAPGTDIAAFVAAGRRLAVTSRDGDGMLELPLVPPGRYLASFAARGGLIETPRSVEVVAGENSLQNWTLAATNGATLTLDVRDKTDRAVISEVTFRLVTINANGALGGGSEPFTALGPPVRSAIPDVQGRVQLFPIQPGRYRIWASRRAQTSDSIRESSPVDVEVAASGATATVILP